MPQTIINEEGDEIEVFTAEELEAQKREALDKFKEENPDKSEEMEKLQKELEEKNKELEGLKDKDINFANMRNKISDKEKEIEELKNSIDDKIGEVKKEVLDSVMKDHYNEVIKKLTGDDKELKEKVELQYKRLVDEANSKEDITKKLKDAFTLATGGEKVEVSTDAFSSGGVGELKVESKGGKKLTPEEIELGKKLASSAPGGMELKDEDFE